MTHQQSLGWHLIRGVPMAAVGALAVYLGGILAGPNAEPLNRLLWQLPGGALVWLGLCHLLQPLIRLISVHFLSIALLMFWSAVLLYFYQSGRVTQYLPDDGLFRPLMLSGGIGLAILGVFNLLTGKSAATACCGHGHEHHHDHHHGHGHGEDCRRHSHDNAHDHQYAHDDGHAHAHQHSPDCCGHSHDDHSHHHHHAAENAPGTCADPSHHHEPGEKCSASALVKAASGGGSAAHDHEHDHGHGGGEHEHSHGILTSPRWFNQSSAVLILLAPLALAATLTPDQFSANAVVNKNLYNPTYGVGARAEQFSLNKNAAASKPNVVAATAPAPAGTPAAPQDSALAPAPSPPPPGISDMPPPPDNSRKVPGSPGPGTTAAVAAMPEQPTGAAATQSYGSFTMADLEAQVPRNKAGNFELNVPEIYYTAGDAEVQKVIEGQAIETVAQVLPEKVNNEDGHRLRVFRLLVQCCAADARPYSVPVDFGKKAPEFKDMTWVRVTGKLRFPKEGGQIVPLIEATAIEETTAPADAMIY